ncbi:MAG: FAD-binding oxidoreductase [Myxococcota bacterium]
MEIIRDPSILEGYLTDASNTTGWAEALVRPRSTEEVSAVLRRCQASGTPVTVTARRTSTTGAPVPHGGWLLSTERLDRIVGLNRVEAGVILGDYQRFVAEQGMLFPPDPTSRDDSTVGAAIANNASGARSYRYGATRPWIEALDVVLPDGTIVREVTRQTPIPDDWPRIDWSEPSVKTAAGYVPADNLLDLFIGQEGTLGVITRARTRLIEHPAGILSLIGFFVDQEACVQFVEAVRASAVLDPLSIEFYDHRSLALVRDRVPDIPETARCALWIEDDYADEPPLAAWWDALEGGQALVDDVIVADDETGRQRLRAVRHAVPAGVNEQIVANGMPKIGTDFAVPDAGLREMLQRYQSVGMPSVLFGHIGDNHLHLNLLPRDAAELSRARGVYGELARAAVALGGTVSAEHGIGKLKRGLLAEMVGPSVVDQFRALKARLDPAGVLGRGTLFAAN